MVSGDHVRHQRGHGHREQDQQSAREEEVLEERGRRWRGQGGARAGAPAMTPAILSVEQKCGGSSGSADGGPPADDDGFGEIKVPTRTLFQGC